MSLVLQTATTSRAGELCTPGAKIQEIVDVVYKFLQDHPEELHLDGDVLIINAMKHAWPCK
jgi:hypothetical protein